jgi:hypothetical protein
MKWVVRSGGGAKMSSTGFADAVILEARQRAHFRCCYCRERPGDEVHHLIPRAEGGPDTIENAVLLCAQCHTVYGHNRDKRKQLQQARDHWYDVAARMYAPSPAIYEIANESTSPPVESKDWYQVESRFERIRGEVWCIWQQHDRTKVVSWNVYSRDFEDRRIVARFLNEARLAGVMAQDVPGLPKKFPGTVRHDAVDEWLNVVSALVPSDRFSGTGSDENGTYTSGSIEDVVDASRIACGRIATEFVSTQPLISLDERKQLIRQWREMVRTIHKQARMTKNASRSITSLLEMNVDFLRFAPYMTDDTKAAVYGRTMIVPPEQSEMSGTLHAILDDINALERKWGLG